MNSTYSNATTTHNTYVEHVRDEETEIQEAKSPLAHNISG
jgi:hypothetical protein